MAFLDISDGITDCALTIFASDYLDLKDKTQWYQLLNKLHEPTYFDNEETLFLGNKALEQLDVLPNSDKPKTLYDIICKTKTPMGKRFLIDQLCNPLIDSNELNNRYDIIEILLKNKLYEKIELNNINDLPKIVRKMELNKVYPNEIFHLYNTLEQIKTVFRTLRSINDIDRKIIDNSHLKSLLSYSFLYPDPIEFP
jgi:DNA mismatch repair protein MutS